MRKIVKFLSPKQNLLSVLLLCLALCLSTVPVTAANHPGETFNVLTEDDLIDALNYNKGVVSHINIKRSFTVSSSCLVLFDPAHISYYSDVDVTIESGVTLTVEDGGAIGCFWPSFQGKWTDTLKPNGKMYNCGTIIVKNGGKISGDFYCNAGTIIIEDGGEAVCCDDNFGTVTVQSGGSYLTTQGGRAYNHGTINIQSGGLMMSRFGTSIYNEQNGTINLNGDFYCGAIKDGTHQGFWFNNNGTVSGSGNVILYDDNPDNPVNLDAMIASMMTQLGQTSRFDDWDDIYIFKKVDVSDYAGLAAAFPGNRVVAGEEVMGDMDVIAVLHGNITMPSGAEIPTMGHIIVPEDCSLTISNGAVLEAGIDIEVAGNVTVQSGGELGTTMGGPIINNGELVINQGGMLKSQMGSSVINERKTAFELNGDFYCGAINDGEGKEGIWFENYGHAFGSGNVILYDANPESPVNLDDMIVAMIDELGQISRFQIWDDIAIYKIVEVSDYADLAAAFPGNRVVAGEEVMGDMDVIAVLYDDVTMPSGADIATLGSVIISEDCSLTIKNGAALEAEVDNEGSITVESGGKLATTQGGSIYNSGSIEVCDGGLLKSQMGARVVNRENGDLTLDGDFHCGAINDGEGKEGIWFENNGDVYGSGRIILYDDDTDNPVNLNAMIAAAKTAIGTGSEVDVMCGVFLTIDLPDPTQNRLYIAEYSEGGKLEQCCILQASADEYMFVLKTATGTIKYFILDSNKKPVSQSATVR